MGLGAIPTLVLAVLAEGLCAALVTLGLLTRAATIPLMATMATAFFIQHADDPFSQAERSFLFLIAWIVLLVTGPGRYSVDAWLKSRAEKGV